MGQMVSRKFGGFEKWSPVNLYNNVGAYVAEVCIRGGYPEERHWIFYAMRTLMYIVYWKWFRRGHFKHL